EAAKGDIRFFLLDGKPICMDGKYAALQRVQQEGEIRSNIHQGARAELAELNEKTMELVSLVADKLIQDNMYLVGLDIVGDKIMEVNVFSPGGLGLAAELNKVDFVGYVIAHLEKKVDAFYPKNGL
ncbi:MAG TPA: glutathione synthase, partial [Sphingobacterium sp.]|nr:glutathione synthase [Sphingobacterium sp.]